jgi:hypothetical protein
VEGGGGGRRARGAKQEERGAWLKGRGRGHGTLENKIC